MSRDVLMSACNVNTAELTAHKCYNMALSKFLNI